MNHLYKSSVVLLLSLGAIFAYTWLEFDDKFDSVAGIIADNKPVSLGVFITSRQMITSANPLNEYIDTNSSQRIKVYTISRNYKRSILRKVEKIAGNQSLRKQAWIPVGYNDTTHTTIHDIAIITVTKDYGVPEYYVPGREPFIVWLNREQFFYDQGWMFAAFGYIDQNHIESNDVLEVSYYSEAALTNCDEWLPREWGRFICLMDDQDLPALASGAPLFGISNNKAVRGLGNFLLKKGEDKVLVFTDMRPYIDNLYS